MKIEKLIVMLLVLFMLTTQAFAWPVLREEGTIFIVELQNRPFALPTNLVTPAILIRVEQVIEDHAIFVWNKTSGTLVLVEGGDFETLMEEYRNRVFSNLNRVLLKFQIGKNNIVNGRVR